MQHIIPKKKKKIKIYPALAQLVERWTVMVLILIFDIHRSSVQIRQAGLNKKYQIKKINNNNAWIA